MFKNVPSIRRGMPGLVAPTGGIWYGASALPPAASWRILSGDGSAVASTEAPQGWLVELSDNLDADGVLVYVPVGAKATEELPYQLFLQGNERDPNAGGAIYHFFVPPSAPLRGGRTLPLRTGRDPALASYRNLSVVIACYGQRHLTEQCLRSLRSDVPAAEVILVDNASPDDTVAWARGQDVRLVEFRQNRGVAAAWNAGLGEATGTVLCVLNNDTIIHPGGMQRLVSGAWRQGIAAFYGAVLDAQLNFLRYTADPDESDYADGCALAFRRDIWQAVGEFDEGFRLAYCEDTDWSLRARVKGLHWGLYPDVLTHLGQQTSATLPEANDQCRQNVDRLRVRWQHKGIGERIVVRRWGALGDVLMATPALAALRRDKPLARIQLQCDPSIADFMQGLRSVDKVSPEIPDGAIILHDLDGVYEDEEQRAQWRHPSLAFAASMGVAVAAEYYDGPDVTDLAAWARERLPLSGYIACGLRSTCRPKVNWSEQGWIDLAQALPQFTFVAIDPQVRPDLEAKAAAPNDGMTCLFRGGRADAAPVIVLAPNIRLPGTATDQGQPGSLASDSETRTTPEPQACPDGEASSGRGETAGAPILRFYDLPNVIDLTGHTPTPRHALALLHRCMACVSVDTGLLHMANVAELPLVGLVGAGPGWARGPLAGQVHIFQGVAPCYPCRNPTWCSREDGPHCLAWLRGRDVATALVRLLRDSTVR